MSRFKCKTLKQKQGATIDSYMAELKVLIHECGYEDAMQLIQVHPQFKMHPDYKQVSTVKAQSLICLSGAELTVELIKNPTHSTHLYIYFYFIKTQKWNGVCPMPTIT